MKLNQTGVGLVDALVGLTLILIMAFCIFGYVRYTKRGLLDVHAKSEWRVLNFQIDSLFRDVLMCEKSNLVREGDPNRILARRRSATPIIPAAFTTSGQWIQSLSQIQYATPNPDVNVVLAKVGGGTFIRVTQIDVQQLLPAVDSYTAATETVHAVPLNISITAVLRHSPKQTLTYVHRLMVDVWDSTFLARSCYAKFSRRRYCEQMSYTFDPLNVGGAICR